MLQAALPRLRPSLELPMSYVGDLYNSIGMHISTVLTLLHRPNLLLTIATPTSSRNILERIRSSFKILGISRRHALKHFRQDTHVEKTGNLKLAFSAENMLPQSSLAILNTMNRFEVKAANRNFWMALEMQLQVVQAVSKRLRLLSTVYMSMGGTTTFQR